MNAVALNRVAKEDTLVVFFLLTAAYLYEKHRVLQSHAAFGLLLASKYLPHYFGLHAAYAYAADPAGRIATPGCAARNLGVLAAAARSSSAARRPRPAECGRDALFHASALLEIWLALRLITGAAPPLLNAFALEYVNRTITIAFRFVPM